MELLQPLIQKYFNVGKNQDVKCSLLCFIFCVLQIKHGLWLYRKTWEISKANMPCLQMRKGLKVHKYSCVPLMDLS